MTRTGKIYSIGHGGLTGAALNEHLRRAEVQFLIDVRSVPYSRHQPEFGRESLVRSLGPTIRYVFMGDLLGGRPDDDSCYTDGRVDYAKTRTKDFFKRGLDRLRNARQQGFVVCMLCSEAQPSQCHRTKMVGQALADEGIEVAHILPDGKVRSQPDVMRDLTGGQDALFAEAQMSRKAYR